MKFRYWTATAPPPSSLLITFMPTHLRWLKMSLPTSGSSPRRVARCRLKISGYGSIQLVRLRFFYPSSILVVIAQKSVNPSDSTSNYIRGNRFGDEPTSAGDRMMTSRGLSVVTVLIGVFSMKSGQPVIGVVNQPFAEYDREKKRCVLLLCDYEQCIYQ